VSGVRVQKGFQLDLNLCTGCGACAVACAIENELPWGTSWRWIETFNPDRLPGLPLHHLSLACNHCADAPCMEHCPALAYTKDPVTGAVLLDQGHCIGCKYCTWACPYDAPRYEPQRGVVSKCTFCHERQLEGHSPACVSQCPTGALRLGDVEALAGSAGVAGFPSTEAAPSIRFVPLRGDAAPEPNPWDQPAQVPPRPAASKISLASEWPLVVFTLLSAGLVGAIASAAGRASLSLPVFLAAAGLAGGASTLHLGRKLRAWRALLNLRRSWLSREAALFLVFVAGSAWHLSGIGAPDWMGTASGVLGFALLYAMDRVYDVTRTPGIAVHSGRVLLTGMLAATVAAGATAAWMGIAGLKAALYLQRKWRGGVPWRPSWAVVRLAGGLLAGPALFLMAASPSWVATGLALLVLGEVVDRCEFYQDLTVPAPVRQAREDLTRMLAARGEALSGSSRTR
jgi:Fe-S-cluster-containing dehydrogenase component/DMSO reductase anchor subunit